ANWFPNTNYFPKTNSEDEFPEDEWPPEEDEFPEGELAAFLQTHGQHDAWCEGMKYIEVRQVL
ncbi:unnamed protein product, partial [Cladocopium goreaui]